MKLRYSLSHLLLVLTIIGLIEGWWLDRSRLTADATAFTEKHKALIDDFNRRINTQAQLIRTTLTDLDHRLAIRNRHVSHEDLLDLQRSVQALYLQRLRTSPEWPPGH